MFGSTWDGGQQTERADTRESKHMHTPESMHTSTHTHTQKKEGEGQQGRGRGEREGAAQHTNTQGGTAGPTKAIPGNSPALARIPLPRACQVSSHPTLSSGPETWDGQGRPKKDKRRERNRRRLPGARPNGRERTPPQPNRKRDALPPRLNINMDLFIDLIMRRWRAGQPPISLCELVCRLGGRHPETHTHTTKGLSKHHSGGQGHTHPGPPGGPRTQDPRTQGPPPHKNKKKAGPQKDPQTQDQDPGTKRTPPRRTPRTKNPGPRGKPPPKKKREREKERSGNPGGPKPTTADPRKDQTQNPKNPDPGRPGRHAATRRSRTPETREGPSHRRWDASAGTSQGSPSEEPTGAHTCPARHSLSNGGPASGWLGHARTNGTRQHPEATGVFAGCCLATDKERAGRPNHRGLPRQAPRQEMVTLIRRCHFNHIRCQFLSFFFPSLFPFFLFFSSFSFLFFSIFPFFFFLYFFGCDIE